MLHVWYSQDAKPGPTTAPEADTLIPKLLLLNLVCSLLLIFREKLPEDEEFAIAGDIAELEAKPIEQTNGKQEANGTMENKGKRL